jgi:purine-cytosine permease-like protein
MPQLEDRLAVGRGALWLLVGLLVVIVDVSISVDFDLLPDIVGAAAALYGATVLLSGIEGADQRRQALTTLLMLGLVVAVLTAFGLDDNRVVNWLEVLQAAALPVLALLLRDTFSAAGRTALAQRWDRSIRYTVFGILVPLVIGTIVADSLSDLTLEDLQDRTDLALLVVGLAIVVLAALIHFLVSLSRTAALRHETA